MAHRSVRTLKRTIFTPSMGYKNSCCQIVKKKTCNMYNTPAVQRCRRIDFSAFLTLLSKYCLQASKSIIRIGLWKITYLFATCEISYQKSNKNPIATCSSKKRKLGNSLQEKRRILPQRKLSLIVSSIAYKICSCTHRSFHRNVHYMHYVIERLSLCTYIFTF